MITDSNNNLMLQLMTSAIGNSFILPPQHQQQQQSLLTTIGVDPLTTTLASTNAESLMTSWSQQQQLIKQMELFSNVPNPTPQRLMPTLDYDTICNVLQLQVLIQQQQQRQALAEKQLSNMQNVLKMLNFMRDSKAENNLLDGLFYGSGHNLSQDHDSENLNVDTVENSFTASQYSINELCNPPTTSSAACSSTSTSRDSTPPQSMRQYNHEYEQFELPPKNCEDIAAKASNTGASSLPCPKTAKKRPHKEVDESESSRPSSSHTSTFPETLDLVPSKKKAKTLKKKLLRQDNVTNSPVSGMFIKENCTPDDLQKAAELDDTASYVHISEEARQNISNIPDVIGDSICALCKIKYEDVFRLAMHRCPRIIHEEYRCPECEKMFSCPANLASHRRWHRPRQDDINEKEVDSNASISNNSAQLIPAKLNCATCHEVFTAKKALRAHKKICSANLLPNGVKSPALTDQPTKVNKTNEDTFIVVDRNESSPITSTVQPVNHISSYIGDRSLENVNAAAALVSLGMPSRVCVA